jgi:hypothetical protein
VVGSADEGAEASSPDADPDRESDDEDDEPDDLALATASGDGAASGDLAGWARACSSSPSANGRGGRAKVRCRSTSASVGAPCEELGEKDMVNG